MFWLLELSTVLFEIRGSGFFQVLEQSVDVVKAKEDFVMRIAFDGATAACFALSLVIHLLPRSSKDVVEME